MATNKLPPHDSNGFYLPNGKPHPRGCYAPPHAPDDNEVDTALAYLSQLTPTKRPTYSSYYLKHRAENWGRRHGMKSYVSNGSLIEAAIRLGLVIKPININADIGVSVRDVKALCKEERAWDKERRSIDVAALEAALAQPRSCDDDGGDDAAA